MSTTINVIVTVLIIKPSKILLKYVIVGKHEKGTEQ